MAQTQNQAPRPPLSTQAPPKAEEPKPPAAAKPATAAEREAAQSALITLLVQCVKALSDNQPTLGLTVFAHEMQHYYNILNPPPPPAADPEPPPPSAEPAKR